MHGFSSFKEGFFATFSDDFRDAFANEHVFDFVQFVSLVLSSVACSYLCRLFLLFVYIRSFLSRFLGFLMEIFYVCLLYTSPSPRDS